jgi:hypothetical protein
MMASQKITGESMEAAQALETIASVSEENNAAVEEVSAATTEMNIQVRNVAQAVYSLSELASVLQKALGQFTLADDPKVITDRTFSHSFMPHVQVSIVGAREHQPILEKIP